ncbi:MAG: phosphodiester glycosidase family protein [Novosphingobium sp.]|nr:phosphodiester glycosidase family protein [Novosphingobium sp.]
MRHPAFPLAVLALAACTPQPVDTADKDQVKPVAKQVSACRADRFEEIPLTVCTADPARDRIRTVLGPAKGAPYRSLAVLAASRAADAPPVAFAVNGGMFDDDGKPIGYYVEDGKRLHLLNRKDGPGNFHMKPNGVFFGTDGHWEIRTSEDFAKNVGKRPDFATQSGPMLVIDGHLHPGISADGVATNIRNGVGVGTDGKAYFVISDGPLSFGKLARYFRDELKTPNALYLDGKVSALWDPATGRLDTGASLGPLIVVEQSGKGGT